MSRKHAGGHVLPDNPTWLEFPRSDGNVSELPKNTTRIVDAEGQVNYMRSVEMDESLAIMWRVSVGSALATRMGLPEGPKYVLKAWPTGYQLYHHQKGPAKAPRHDPYLYGSVNVNRFRSTNEFIPHALWLMTDETMNRVNCQCRYCTKQPQRIISDTMGLSARRSASVAAALPPSVSRPRARRDAETRQRTRQERAATKPFAAVRRAPKPPKVLVGPTQYILPERDLDIRASIGYIPGQSPRRYRKGELLWCHLDPPIRGRSPEEDILFWPGIVEEVLLKSHPVQVPLPEDDATMERLYAEAQDENPEPGELSTDPSSTTPSSAPSTVPVEAPGKVPWTVEQWYVYRVKLLGTTYGVHRRDEEVLPYLAYAPSDRLVSRVQEELDAYLQNVSIEEMDRDLEQYMFSFDPTEEPADEEGVQAKYRNAVASYTMAIQIASNVAQYWLPTDEWECTFSLPTPPSPPRSKTQQPPPSRPPPEPQLQNTSLHSLIQQSLSNNAISPTTVPGPNGSVAEPESISMVGRAPRSTNNTAQSVTQTRFQGLWWGTERIWTDELVRLKIARAQFAPKGTDVIFPPAGPSASTLAHVRDTSNGVEVNIERLGAADKGLFLRLEGLVVVDVPLGDGSFTKECRASGMLYELADEDWEEEDPTIRDREVNGKGKGKAREETDFPMSISQGPDAPSFMTQPSPLKPPPLPNPDPTVPTSETVSAVLSQTTLAAAPTAPSASEKQGRISHGQLSHPVLSTSYPLPQASKGFRLRPILPSGHEVVLSLSLISGRYYPGVLQHPLLQQALEEGLSKPENVLQYRHLWALDGLSPGVHQSMDPRFWRGSRVAAFQDADKEARERFKEMWEETKMARLHPEVQGSADHVGMDVD